MTKNLFIGNTAIHLERVDSTNNYARQLVRDKMPIEGTVIVADAQTAGRGQRTNSWVSEPGKNLTCSYILKPVFLAAKDQFMLSASVALAVFDTVSSVLAKETVKIKWPNDVLVDGKKIAGILIENSLRGTNLDHSIVGIGINVNQTDFPEDLNATSFKTVSKKNFQIDELILALSSHLEKRYLQLRQRHHQPILSQFNRNLYAFEEERVLTVNDAENTFRILGARPSGELQLRHSDGRNTLHQHHEIVWNLS